MVLMVQPFALVASPISSLARSPSIESVKEPGALEDSPIRHALLAFTMSFAVLPVAKVKRCVRCHAETDTVLLGVPQLANVNRLVFNCDRRVPILGVLEKFMYLIRQVCRDDQIFKVSRRNFSKRCSFGAGHTSEFLSCLRLFLSHRSDFAQLWKKLSIALSRLCTIMRLLLLSLPS